MRKSVDFSGQVEKLNDLSPGEDHIDLGYSPRPFQQMLHNKLKRFNVIVAHRRFGKTVFSIMELIHRVIECGHKNPQVAYLAPTYAQAKRVAWAYVLDFTSKIPGATANKQELTIYIPRPDRGDVCKIMLLGGDNPDSLRGIYLDFAVLDEFATMNPVVWGEIIRPALSDRLGGAIFISTPAGENSFYKIYRNFTGLMKEGKGYFTGIYPAEMTKVVDPDELEDAKATMSESEYKQEYECDFTAALQGSYYASYVNDIQDKGRVCDFEYDRTGGPVVTAWDLGISDSTAIWFAQVVGREIRIIDYLEADGKGLEYYAKEILSKPYMYANYGHYLPHDAAARELGTGLTRQEMLTKFGIRSQVVPRQSVADGINAARVLLTKNIWFEATKTERGVDCLKNYQRQFDAKRSMFMDKPLHDWTSHGADAFRMLAWSLKNPAELKDFSELRRIKHNNDYNELDY